MQVLSAANQSAMGIITIDIPKSQVTMLAKNGATNVDKGGKSYSMNAMAFSKHKYCENINDGVSNNKFNGEIKPPYLLDNLPSRKNEYFHSNLPSPIFLDSLMSLGDQKKDLDDTADNFNNGK